LPGCVLEQCILPDTPREFVGTLLTGVSASLRIAGRIALRDPQLCRGDLIFDLSQRTVQLAKLIAMDVMRARQADPAMRVGTGGREFEGANVVFAFVGMTPENVIDLHLQRKGATTFDFLHGVTGSLSSHLPSHASVRCVWIKPDAEVHSGGAQFVEITGMPH